MILKLEAPDLGFRFEWHPESRKLYSIVLGTGLKHEELAANIERPEAAQLAVVMWCRGYRSRARELVRPPGAKSYQMLAESGAVGAKVGR